MSRRNIWTWILVASLSLNAFALTFFITHRPPPPPGDGGPPPPGEMIGHILRDLPGEDAAIFKRALEPYMAEINATYPIAKSAMERYRKALTADAFDAEDLNAALRDIHVARNRFEQALNAAVVDAASTMSPEGRRRLHMGPPGPPPH